MGELKSLSLFVGTGDCNADCQHCAGKPLRKYAPKKDGIIDEELILKTALDCYQRGARSISISSSGEPTLSPLAVTKTLKLLNDITAEGIYFSKINLYSNGIRIGTEKNFCDNYLYLWKTLGLSTIYITLHGTSEYENAQIYRVSSYPSIDLILTRIHDADLKMRANLVLNKKTIGTNEQFASAVEYLLNVGADFISAWPIRDSSDRVDKKLSPLEEELDKMEAWIIDKNLSEKGIILLREKSKISYELGEKLTLFPDGTLSNTWCNNK